MKKTKKLLVLVMLCLLASVVFSMTVKKVYANTKNEVTLNFEGGIIHDGYVKYDEIGSVQLLKNDVIVTDINNNMKIDLNEANYELLIKEDIWVGNPNSVVPAAKVRLTINGWHYAISNEAFKLDTNKFNGALNIKLERTNTVINTKVEKIYTDITSKGIIDLTNGKEYVIDFSKDDQLTNGLKTFTDLEKTLYYKRENDSLIKTENKNEAVIKIVGNKQENKAILTAVNIGNKKEEGFSGFHTKYTGSKLQYDGTEATGIINETRTDYYTICTYDFTFQYVKEETEQKEYKVIEGANQTYTIGGESKNATFRIDAEYNLFENGGKVYIDGVLVNSNNYTSKSGSTIITLKDTYLKTLSIGKHTLKVSFTDGGEAITKFEIRKKQKNIEENKNGVNEENTNIENNEDAENKNNTNNNSNPKTGDNIIMYIIAFIVSIAGIITIAVINRKKQSK